MSAYVTVLVLGAGVGIGAFWLGALAMGKVDELGDLGASKWWHIAAELTTAGLALTAGVARVTGHPAKALTGVALGALLYASLQSPGYYLRKQPALAWLLGATGLALIPAIVFVLR